MVQPVRLIVPQEQGDHRTEDLCFCPGARLLISLTPCNMSVMFGQHQEWQRTGRIPQETAATLPHLLHYLSS